MTARQPECRDVLINASTTLPKLYDEKEFDSLRVAIGVIKKYCDANSPGVMYVGILLDMQQSSFDVNSLDSGNKLNALLVEYPQATRDSKGYGLPMRRYYYFSDYERVLFAFIQRWATDLLHSNSLNDEETFICNVLAGNLKHPETTLKANKTKYPQLYALVRKNYGDSRSHGAGVMTFSAGTWIPSGNLSILGTHPQFGLQFGGRGKNNELDLTLQVRVGRSSHYYTVLRSDSVYSRNNFTGGYVGLDFAHYFYTSTNFEAGLLVGAGYDGFDISGDTNDHNEDYLKPWGIGSFNFNTGFRMNYFFNPRLFIGIVAKHNYISYHNHGGTDMSGNAFSIDLLIGGSGR